LPKEGQQKRLRRRHGKTNHGYIQVNFPRPHPIHPLNVFFLNLMRQIRKGEREKKFNNVLLIQPSKIFSKRWKDDLGIGCEGHINFTLNTCDLTLLVYQKD
jgi:hypothetical protein